MFSQLFRPRGADATRLRYGASVEWMRAEIARLAGLSDEQLQEKALVLRKERLSSGEDVRFSWRAVSLVAESLRRSHGYTAYDCQLVAALVLAGGEIAEMATGEGKTLVAALAAFVFSLSGKGVHVATVNPYLAERDCEFARPALERLGVSVGLLRERVGSAEKRAAYAADVTYGVGTEFGFDYLRDQLAIQAAGGVKPPLFHKVLLGTAGPGLELVQRGHAYAIIDEADSILIDEARSPLIISIGLPRACEAPLPYLLADRLACAMEEGVDFSCETPGNRLVLTAAGRAHAAGALTEEVLPLVRRSWPRYVEQALQARRQFRRDVHYIVSEGKVVIVDEFTGRPCPDRSWRDGLHQAVEVAAGVTVTEENASEATITRPAYFRLYETVCGMTGTAAESAGELRSAYGLGIRVIPLHRPCRRVLLPDRVFRDRAAKLRAVAADVAVRHGRGQPVLIGTRTVRNSEELAVVMEGFPFRILNAKQDALEAEIIAKAGEPGVVTIATNMAGRGAHIPLPPESERVGGLHVIGLERHESSRIDRQLTGRAARQGQPGSAQFFLSLEDDLIMHDPTLCEKLAAMPVDAAGELPARAAALFLRAQARMQSRDRLARQALAEYDRWIDELKKAL